MYILAKLRYVTSLYNVKKVLSISPAGFVSCSKKDWIVKSFDKAKWMSFLIKGFADIVLLF